MTKYARWTARENRDLLDAHAANPGKWKAISEAVGTRDPESCRMQFTRKINPLLNMSPWLWREVMLMILICKQYAEEEGRIRFSKVKVYMSGRPDSECKKYFAWVNNGRHALDSIMSKADLYNVDIETAVREQLLSKLPHGVSEMYVSSSRKDPVKKLMAALLYVGLSLPSLRNSLDLFVDAGFDSRLFENLRMPTLLPAASLVARSSSSNANNTQARSDGSHLFHFLSVSSSSRKPESPPSSAPFSEGLHASSNEAEQMVTVPSQASQVLQPIAPQSHNAESRRTSTTIRHASFSFSTISLELADALQESYFLETAVTLKEAVTFESLPETYRPAFRSRFRNVQFGSGNSSLSVLLEDRIRRLSEDLMRSSFLGLNDIVHDFTMPVFLDFEPF
eukprot:ANDGO_05495.mRNA.1 hypothetical protein